MQVYLAILQGKVLIARKPLRILNYLKTSARINDELIN